MPNFVSLTTPESGTFIVSAGVVGQSPLYSELFSIDIDVNVFVPDRRPIVAGGYATQTTRAVYNGVDNLIPAEEESWVGMIWGAPESLNRKTPALTEPDSAFDVYAVDGVSGGNGKLGSAARTTFYIDNGFERYHYWNLGGFTNTTGGGNLQDYYASIPYSGLFLDSVDYITTKDSTVGVINSPSPYTPDGTGAGVPGDNQRAWIAKFNEIKTRVGAGGGVGEIGVYCGYRPMYTDSTMTTPSRVHLGMDPNWSGTGDSPGYAPEPGSDYVDANNPGSSSSTANFVAHWAPEVAGLKSMGVDLIGLDTGGKMWLNSAGMTVSGSPGNKSDQPTRLGDGRLNSVFDNLGIQQYGESAPMWSYGPNGRSLGNPPDGVVNNQGAYDSCPYLSSYNQQCGYDGLDEDGIAFAVGSGGGFWIYNEAAADGGATIGRPTSESFPNGSYKFNPATTEIHGIVNWGEQTLSDRYLKRPDGSGGFAGGWTTLKQVLYDSYTAGMIIGVGGSVTSSIVDAKGYTVTPLEFHAYVMDLNNGVIATRPI
jgi:hypothetical protein